MSNTHDFIEALHRSHLDNGTRVYYRAEAEKNEIMPVMPAAPFIFEYFLFNSIYQHDWESTDTSLVAHESTGKNGLREWQQQMKLLDYLEKECVNKPELIGRAFASLRHEIDLSGEWTTITPDHNLNQQIGDDFFSNLREIQGMLRSNISKDSVHEFFMKLNTCRKFVGKVRNNIFHGAKSLDQIWEDGQKRRLEIYYLFIRSLNALFFLTRSETKRNSAGVSFPKLQLPEMVEKPFYLPFFKTRELQANHMMKNEDPELIVWANKILRPLREHGKPAGALFYPSAGKDIITPVLLGLPFCSDFYFYDDGRASGWDTAFAELGTLLGMPHGFPIPKNAKRSIQVEFKYDGVVRRIYHTREDNEQFLSANAPLVFFFHRGDSLGEGGSDQPWDGKWFHRWKQMIPPKQCCAVLTDGIPHGVDNELAPHLTIHPILRSTPHRGRYHCGIIPFSQ